MIGQLERNAYYLLIHYQLTSQANLTGKDIEEIIKPYTHDPLPRKPPDNIPNDVSDISTYPKFVNRGKEIIKLMKNLDNLYHLITNPKAFSNKIFRSCWYGWKRKNNIRLGGIRKSKDLFYSGTFQSFRCSERMLSCRPDFSNHVRLFDR
jgi:hypothetical protein